MRRLMRCRRATTLAFLLFASVGIFQASQPLLAMQSTTPIAFIPCPRAWEEVLSSRTRGLTADCVTELAITVPNGWTLDGGGHTIHVVDPGGSRFRGGVVDVRNGVVSIRNVAIDGSALTPECSPETTDPSRTDLRVCCKTGECGGPQDLRPSLCSAALRTSCQRRARLQQWMVSEAQVRHASRWPVRSRHWSDRR